MLTTNERNLQSQVDDVEEFTVSLKDFDREAREGIKMYLKGIRDGMEMSRKAV